MQEERKKVLEMLASGKISVEEAERLLNAINENNEDQTERASGNGVKPKYLRVQVEPKANDANGDRVNIRVPINLIRAGLKWASFIPKDSQHKASRGVIRSVKASRTVRLGGCLGGGQLAFKLCDPRL